LLKLHCFSQKKHSKLGFALFFQNQYRNSEIAKSLNRHSMTLAQW